MKLVIKFIVPCCATLLALVALFLLFGKCVAVVDTDSAYSGFQVIFGHSEEVWGKKVQMLAFCFPAFLAFIFLVAGIVLAWLDMIPFNNFISAGLLLVAAVLTFCFPAFINVAEEGLGAIGQYAEYSAKACLIISGILNILAAGVICAKAYLDKVVSKLLK